MKILSHSNLVNFKIICYQPLAITFEYVLFSSPPFPQFVKLVDWMGILGFSITFRLKRLSLFFFKTKVRFDWWLQFLHDNGIAHQYLKPANILVSNKHYANITDHAELTMKTHWLWENQGHWFVKQELFERHKPNICNVVRCFLWYLENMSLKKQIKKIYWKLISGSSA